MASFIKTTIKKKNLVIYNASDTHVGSKAFNEKAFNKLVGIIRSEGAYMTFGGDMIEGKKVSSPHFNPQSLRADKQTIEEQCMEFVSIVYPIRDRILLLGMGNHELYLLPDMNIVKLICKDLGRPSIEGGYQTWLQLNGVTMHFWHGKPTMPRGAKDPIQREANQKAWLKNRFENLAGSAQAHYMAHTHQCLIVPPLQKYALLNSGDNVKGVYFSEPLRDVNGLEYWHPDARWYVNTGTFRREGGFDYTDYSEIAGYAPPAIACTKTTIEGNRIVNIEKVVF